MDVGPFDFRKVMGEKTMFDLNEQIKNWRDDLAQSQTLEKTDIDELENHLREEIERLAASELSEQEAFLVAAHRLGHSDGLSEEFAKINAPMLWRKRLFWAGAVVFAWLIVTYIGQVVSRTCVLVGVFAGLRGYTLNIIDILSQVTFFCIVAFTLYKISKTRALHDDLFCKIADSFRGKVMLFVIVFVIVVGTLAFKTLIMAITARFLNPQEFGQISMLKSYQGLIRVIFLPLALLLGMILIRPSKLRKAEV